MQSNSESERKYNVKYCNPYKGHSLTLSCSQSVVTRKILKFPISLTKFIPLVTEEESELVEGSLGRATPTQQLQLPTASPRSRPARPETYKVRSVFSRKENWLCSFPCALRPADSTFLGHVTGLLSESLCYRGDLLQWWCHLKRAWTEHGVQEANGRQEGEVKCRREGQGNKA